MAVSLGDIKDVVSLASSVLKVGQNCYHASNVLEDFKANVSKLESTYESWERRARKYGLSSERTFHLSLKEAEEQLQREEARLKSLDRGCGCLCFWLSSGTDFPAQLGKSIVNLNNSIPSNWKADNDAEDAARERAEASARTTKFGFKRDSRYVRLPVIEKELKNILNIEDNGEKGIRVVLLYGRAGSGKSSMVRNLALDYTQAATTATDGSASKSANGCCKFDDVLYVECGLEANSKAKQAELLGMLQWKRPSNVEKDSVADKLILEQLLKERRSLIIFDDVWEGRFLKDMVGVCGKHMKILVTSQKKYLCTDSLIEKTKPVPMDQIEMDDSVRILKVHTGFEEDEDIPKTIKECMDDLVAKVCGHPHALASVAVAIDANHKMESRQWEDAISEYDQLLEDPLSKFVMNPLHDVQYERSFMEAIRVKFRRLSEEEKKLMVLMAMFKGPSVPEEILRLFYGEIVIPNEFEGVGSCRSFSNVRKRLEDLQCIKSGEYRRKQICRSVYHGEQCVDWGWQMETKGLSWSIHSLDDQFIQKNMSNDIDVMLEVVNHLPDKIQGLEAEPQVNVTKLLGLLFFKSPFCRPIGRLHDHLLPLSRWRDSVREKTCVMSLFLICLMAKNIGRGWSMTLQKSSYQIFLSLLIGDGTIHNNAAEELLKSSISKHQLWTLMRWWMWDQEKEWSISENVIMGVLRIFGDLHSFTDTSSIISLTPDQWNSLLVLVSRPVLLPARHRVFQMRKLVLGLIDMLKSPCCSRKTKHLSTVVLSYLVPLMYERPSEYGQEGLASIPMIVEELIHSLEEYSDEEVHTSANNALFALALSSNSDVKQKIISIGFHQLLGTASLEREEGGDWWLGRRRNVFTLEIVECLASGESRCFQNLLSASIIQDLSHFLTKAIEKEPSDARQGHYQSCAVRALMKVDPARVNSMSLHSYYAFQARGESLVRLGKYHNGISDLGKAQQLSPQEFYNHGDLVWAKVQLKDWEGALQTLDRLSPDGPGDGGPTCSGSTFYTQRGTLKRMMGNLPGALEDLNKAIYCNDQYDCNQYRVLKQSAYVKFLMGDEEGARVDAKETQQFTKPHFLEFNFYLTESIVEFLNFRL